MVKYQGLVNVPILGILLPSLKQVSVGDEMFILMDNHLEPFFSQYVHSSHDMGMGQQLRVYSNYNGW